MFMSMFMSMFMLSVVCCMLYVWGLRSLVVVCDDPIVMMFVCMTGMYALLVCMYYAKIRSIRCACVMGVGVRVSG